MDGRNLQTAYPDDYATSVYNAAGQMIRSKTAHTDALRRYDGSGREIKRRIANFHETANSLDWVIQPTKYYIRSSVLGNEVVSEVRANGRKGKTFVRAAGAQLAVQSAYASDAASLQEAVFFEYTDASGMSQRTTDKLGAATASGDGGESSPVETDPLGGNVGTYTPYVELLPPFDPLPEYPMLQPYLEDAPHYIDGQRVSCTLDGMAIRCSQAFRMMANGSAAQCPNNDCGPRTGTYRDIYGKDHHFVAPLTLTDKGFGLQVPSGIQRIREVDAMILAIRGGDWRTYANAFQSPNINIGTFQVTVKADDDEPFDPDKDDFLDLLRKIIIVDELISKRVKFIGLTDDQTQSIKVRLKWMLLWKPCVDAFKESQPTLQTPREVIKDRGLVYSMFDLLQSSGNNNILGITEKQCNEVVSKESLYSDGTTVSSWQGSPVYTFFRPRSFDNKGTYSTSEIVVHEMIHGTGVGPVPGFWGTFGLGHDHSGYDYYDKIQKNCHAPKEIL